MLTVFFRTVHVFCPVLDEADFLAQYNGTVRGGSKLYSLLVQAAVFAGFGHASDDQVEKSPWNTVMEGQKTLFEIARASYHSLKDAHLGSLELTQAAVILSHWSPFDDTEEVNIFWVDEAFQNALHSRLHASFRRLNRRVWWCCLVRNRLTALGLRRPDTLKHIRYVKGFDALDIDTSESPGCCSIGQIRLLLQKLFVQLCVLSEIMY
jgi:hypothetical protein